MHLASLLQLFDALRELPNAHLYVGDLKAWFNQISIPEGIKPLFTLLLADGRMLEYNTLVMGGQPSAKLAHGITCLWIIAAMESLGFAIMDPGAAAAPPILRFSETGKHVTSVVPWIDNWCAICDSESRRDSIKQALRNLQDRTKGWGIMIKDGSESSQPASSPFDFLGLRWKVVTSESGQVSVLWRHITRNMAEWRGLERIQAGTASRARHAARLIGIITWDFSARRAASGDVLRISAIDGPLTASARLSEGRHSRKDWDGSWTASKALADSINRSLDTIFAPFAQHLDGGSEEELDALMFTSRPPAPRPARKVLSASDASKTRGGHVRFLADGSIQDWIPVEFPDVRFEATVNGHGFTCSRDTHINRLETACAIVSLNRTLDQLEASGGTGAFEFRHAIDNSTARSALRLGRYPGCPELTAALAALHARINRSDSRLTILQVPSGDMVADDPSRNDEKGRPIAPSQERALRCLSSMDRADVRPASHKSKRDSQ